MAKKHKPSKVIQLPQTVESQIRTRARSLELGKCYLNPDWPEERMAVILVTRKHKQGGTTFGFFRVDLDFFGVEQTSYDFNRDAEDFEKMRKEAIEGGMVEAEYALVHNIIYGAVEFADECGNKPHKNFKISEFVLEPDDDRIPFIPIEFGDGENLDDYDDDDEYPEYDNELEITPFIFMVQQLPEISADQIKPGFPDGINDLDTFYEWGEDDLLDYINSHAGQWPLELLKLVVLNAWADMTEIFDQDHFGYQFDRRKKRTDKPHPEADALNSKARKLLEERRFEEIPDVYNGEFTYKKAFPVSKGISEPSASEYCRIYCEYFIAIGDLEEATSYSLVMDILEGFDNTPEALATTKKLLVGLMKEIRGVASDDDEIIIKNPPPGQGNPWEQFLDLTDEIKALAPWKKMLESDVFGIELPDSKKNYFVSVMGSLGESYSIAFYEEIEGVLEFWNLQNMSLLNIEPEYILTVPHYIISWEQKRDVEKSVMAAIKESGRKYSGKQSWPNIMQTIPGYVPQEPDASRMGEVIILLQQTLNVLKRHLKTGRVIPPQDPDHQTYLFRLQKDGKNGPEWQDGKKTVTPKQGKAAPKTTDPKLIKTFNSLPVGWEKVELGFTMLTTPIKNKEQKGAPVAYFPFVLMGVDSEQGMIVLMDVLTPLPDFLTMVDSIMEKVLEHCIRQGKRPSHLTINNLRLFPLLDLLEKNTPVKVNFASPLRNLDEAMNSLKEELGSHT